jgi:hypothetical protein
VIGVANAEVAVVVRAARAVDVVMFYLVYEKRELYEPEHFNLL